MRTLSIDIETSPGIRYFWQPRDDDLTLDKLIQPPRMLCFAARFLGEKQMHFHSVWDDGRFAMAEAAWALLDEADAVMHYNGQRFDVPHLNAAFLEADHVRQAAGFPKVGPPTPYKQLDLLTTARKFRLVSHKLQYLSEFIGLAGKEQTGGFPLWVGAISGNEKAQRKMERYNKRDVVLLEEAHDELLPWIPNYPSVPLHDGGDGCPRCGHPDSTRRGTYKTKVSEFQQFQCKKCRGYWRLNKRSARVTKQAL